MREEHFFADVDLPFHVWVREERGGVRRWVLRDASPHAEHVASRRADASMEPPRGPRDSGD